MGCLVSTSSPANQSEWFIYHLYKDPGLTLTDNLVGKPAVVPPVAREFLRANKGRIHLDAIFMPHPERKPTSDKALLKGHTALTAFAEAYNDPEFLQEMMASCPCQAPLQPIKNLSGTTDALSSLIINQYDKKNSIAPLARAIIGAIPKENRAAALSQPSVATRRVYWNLAIEKRPNDVDLFKIFLDEEFLGGNCIDFTQTDIGTGNTILHQLALSDRLYSQQTAQMMEDLFSSGQLPDSMKEFGVNLLNADGFTPLMLVAHKFALETIKEFVAQNVGGQISFTKPEAKVVLKRDTIAQIREKERLDSLKPGAAFRNKNKRSEVETIADPEGSDQNYSALHYLVDGMNDDLARKDCLELLLSARGATEVKDLAVNFGKDNALTLAIRNKLSFTLNYLIANGCKKELPPNFNGTEEDIYQFAKSNGINIVGV